MGKLFVVATPIGNLGDITRRGIETLSSVDFVLAEDSREAHKLLNSLELKKEIVVYHQHSSDTDRLKIFERLQRGQNAALITDAGTPGVSDPGNELVSFLVTFDPKSEIVPVPGASSLTALLSVSGFKTQQFTFLGFLPKKKHTKMWGELKQLTHPFVFFESPHRIIKTLHEMTSVFDDEVQIVLGREITKIHETILRGNIMFVTSELEKNLPVKGEIVVIVDPVRLQNIPS